MARFIGAAAVLLATALSGCGDKGSGAESGPTGDSGAVGTWTIDMEPMIAKQRGRLLEALKTPMKRIEEAREGLTGAQQEKARDMALEAAPAELKDLMAAMLTSEAAGMEAMNKWLAEKLRGFDATLEIKSGGTFTLAMAMGGQAQRVEGMWTLAGDNLTLTTTRKDGKPHEDKFPIVLLLREGQLALADPDLLPSFPFTFKRKRAP